MRTLVLAMLAWLSACGSNTPEDDAAAVADQAATEASMAAAEASMAADSAMDAADSRADAMAHQVTNGDAVSQTTRGTGLPPPPPPPEGQ